jgi:hypothetical protein
LPVDDPPQDGAVPRPERLDRLARGASDLYTTKMQEQLVEDLKTLKAEAGL